MELAITLQNRAKLSEAFLQLFEENTTPLSAYQLATSDGRREFLYRLSEKGEGGIIEAVQVIWTQLQEPKSYYCAKIAKASDQKGSGKKVLFAVMTAFVEDFNSIEPQALPLRNDFPTFAQWNLAVSACFEGVDETINSLLDRWEPILHGCAHGKQFETD
jgi:hypothetical protein